MDPKRLIEDGADAFERQLLLAARGDAISPRNRRQIFAGLGLAIPVSIDASLGGSSNLASPDQLGSAGQLGSVGDLAGAADVPGADVVLTHAPGAGMGGAISNAGALPKVGALLEEGALLSGAATKGALLKGSLALLGASTLGAVGVWLAVSGSPVEPAAEIPPAPAVATVATGDGAEPELGDRAESGSSGSELDDPGAFAHDVEQLGGQSAEGVSRAASRGRPSKVSGDSIALELELIEAARAALAKRDAGTALSRLRQYRQQFPKGSLRAEEAMLRIQALIATGDRAAANRLGKAMLERSPNGPYARRIRSLLGQGSTSDGTRD